MKSAAFELQRAVRLFWSFAFAVSFSLIRVVAGQSVTAPQVPSSSNIITTNYYVFGGTNDVQLRAAMVETRPWKQAMTYDAHTKWDVQSTYRYSRTNGEFKLASFDVKTKVAITLPMWIPGKPVSRELVSRWQKCFTGLSVHEQGHAQLALAAGAEVRRRLGDLPGFPSSQELTAAAERALKDTIDEFQQRERKYDEVTGHGRTQGAVFPIEVKTEEDVIFSSAPTNGSPRYPGMRRR